MFIRSIKIHNWCIKSVYKQSFIRCTSAFQRYLSTKANLNSLTPAETVAKLRVMDPTIKIRNDPVVIKLDSPQFKSIFSRNLKTLVELFQKYNYEIRIAGGAVRDLLMNKTPSDLDFASTATPEQMVAMFNAEKVRMFNTNGISHGTVTARINDEENFEVTTLRIDVKTDGRHAKVEFTKNWVLDANRRDLTINSMYLGLDGSVYDWFYGHDDLQQRRVAFVGVASERIKEDYLRILRYFRFYGRIAEKSNNHETATLTTITENISGLKQISGERIWGELKKILAGNFAIELLKTMFDCQIAQYIGLSDTVNYDELDRLHTIMQTSFTGIAYNPVTILATQLTAIDDATKLQARLKMSAYERDLAAFLAHHKLSSNDLNDLLSFQKIIVINQTSSPIGVVREYVLELLLYQGKREIYDQLKAWSIPRLPVTGRHLADAGVPPGKKMGFVQQRFREIWTESHFKLTADELLAQLPNVLNDFEETRKTSPILNKTIKKRK